MTRLTIDPRYAGPPMSANGGYVAGLLARNIDGPAKAVLRAIIPLGAPLGLSAADGRSELTEGAGALIAEAERTDVATLPEPLSPPSLEEAHAAGLR